MFLVRSCFVLVIAVGMRTKGERLFIYNIVGGIGLDTRPGNILSLY